MGASWVRQSIDQTEIK